MDGTVGFEKFDFIGFEDVTSVRWFNFAFNGTGFHQYDNIVTDASPVPLPATVWLFGSAIAGLVGFQSRKSKVSVAVA